MNRTLPILAALFLLTGCPPEGMRPQTPLDLTKPETPLEFTRITPDGQPVIVSGMSVPEQIAVFDQASFADQWQRVFANRDPAPAPPAVDFHSDFVVFAALGERSSGGYAIDVVRALGGGSNVLVEIQATAPGRNCPVPLVITQPVDIVRIKRPADGPLSVRYESSLVTRDCTK